MNEIIMKALVDCAVFFEFSKEPVIEDDAAVKQLEQLAYHLQQLNAEDSEAFSAFCVKNAAEAPDEKVARFISALPESCGI